MASRLLDALTTKGTHAVGSINSWKIRTLPYGAIVDTADVDNFTIVELGFNSDGERICKQLSDKAIAGYLVASPERRYVDGELMYDFYNKTGERARIVLLDTGLRFETSAFTLDEGDETATPAREAVAAVAKGCVAHFDKTAKKFIISAAATPHADYDNAANQFLVVATEDDTDAIDGIDVIRLEVIK
jgi:hypothetical protein